MVTFIQVQTPRWSMVALGQWITSQGLVQQGRGSRKRATLRDFWCCYSIQFNQPSERLCMHLLRLECSFSALHEHNHKHKQPSTTTWARQASHPIRTRVKNIKHENRVQLFTDSAPQLSLSHSLLMGYV